MRFESIVGSSIRHAARVGLGCFVASLGLVGCAARERHGATPPHGHWGAPSPHSGETRGPDPRSPHVAERAAAFAHAMQGKPYCWGGTGPDCFDCSGLTSTAWRVAGLPIPRTSDAQHERLASVGMHELAPGDVLWRPGHVGLYLGNGWAIHAPGRGKFVQYQAASSFRSAHRPRGGPSGPDDPIARFARAR
ncbi:MAG: NlpC/P60 family protein [Myxococcales bacterium]|nr:NlpC/P60 family protein [Myxococcales bacterium]